jgi:transposase
MIEKTLKKSCKSGTITNILKRHNYRWKRYRKSLKSKQDPILFEFFKNELAILRKQASRGLIDLLYFDGSGFNLNPNVPYGWLPKGQKVYFPAERHLGWTVLGAINIENSSFEGNIYEGSCNAETVIQVIDEIAKNITKKTILVLDNASIHKANIVKKQEIIWRSKGLYLQFIPAYCPELNLIEIVWKHMKYYWLEPDAYTSKEILYAKIIEILQSYGKNEYSISFT